MWRDALSHGMYISCGYSQLVSQLRLHDKAPQFSAKILRISRGISLDSAAISLLIPQ